MKNKGIRVVLAVILALVLLLGTVSFVEAKGNPNRTASVTAIATFDGTAYDLSFHLSWYAYRINRISTSWQYYDVDHWEYIMSHTYDLPKASRNYSGNFNLPAYNPQDRSSGELWKINIVLYTPKGKDNWVVAKSVDNNITIP